MNRSWSKIKKIILQLRGLAAIGIADILASVIGAIFWFYMAVSLGAEQYGAISYFLAIASIASSISLIGSEDTLKVYTAKNVKIQSSIYFIALILASVASIIIFLIFHTFGVSILVIGYVIFGLAVSVILGRKAYTTYSKYVITQKILMIGLVIGFYHFIGPNGVILGMAVSFFPYSIIIYKEFKESKINFSLIKPSFGFMMNNYILSLLAIAIRSSDKLLIVQMLDLALLGNYQLGIQFLEILQIFPAVIYKYTLPQDVNGSSNKKLKKVTVYISIVLAILIFTLSPIIVPIVFVKFTEVVQIIQISIFAVVPSSISVVYISKFMGREKGKVVLASSGLYFVTQILSIIFLGRLFGINGISAALVIAGTVQALFLVTVDRLMREK